MYPRPPEIVPSYRRVLGWSLAIGAVASLLLVVGAMLDPAQFFRAYLAAYLFCLGLSLGSLAVLMIYHTTGGAWGFLVRRFLEAGVRTLPLVAVGFVPIALGIHYLYPWAQPAAVEASRVLPGQSIYLNEPFFFGRAIGYFVIWIAWGFVLTRWSRRQDREHDRWMSWWLDGFSGMGLLVYGVTIHFAAVDWFLTLQPVFHSTAFGPIVASGQLVSALALATILLCLLADRPPLADLVGPKTLNDVGNLLLAFTIVWAYISWFQYLLGWIANLPYDAVWYVPRLSHGWEWIALLLVVFHFAVPVLLLLWRATKRNRHLLGGVAALLLAMQAVFAVYQVIPAFQAFGIAQHWMVPVALVALTGLWLTYYLWQLGSWPILPEFDYNETEAARLRASDAHEAAWEEVFSHG